MRTWVLWAGLASLGCGQVPMTEVAIDPTLTAEEQAAVVAAAETWFQAVPAARLPIRIGEDRGKGYVTRDACTSRPGTFGATLLGAANTAPRVYFCEVLSPEIALQVMTHELGHALAYRDDHLPCANLMAESLYISRPTLTADDVAYVSDAMP